MTATLAGLAAPLLAACLAAVPPPLAPTASTPPPPPSAMRDFDGDGFADPFDRCPREAGVAPHGCLPPASPQATSARATCCPTVRTTPCCLSLIHI